MDELYISKVLFKGVSTFNPTLHVQTMFILCKNLQDLESCKGKLSLNERQKLCKILLNTSLTSWFSSHGGCMSDLSKWTIAQGL